jgi:hypothetical protein
VIRITKCVREFVRAICLIGLVAVAFVGPSGAAELQAGAWSGGAAIGFLGYTPDGTAFATKSSRRLFSESPGVGGPAGTIGRDRGFISDRCIRTGEVLA